MTGRTYDDWKNEVWNINRFGCKYCIFPGTIHGLYFLAVMVLNQDYDGEEEEVKTVLRNKSFTECFVKAELYSNNEKQTQTDLEQVILMLLEDGADADVIPALKRLILTADIKQVSD